MMDFSEEEHCVSEQELILLIAELKTRITNTHFAGSLVPRTDTHFLSKFLRTKDYNLDVALISVQKYYGYIQRNLDFIEGIRPSEFEIAFHSQTIIPLKHNFDGIRVAIIRVRNWIPKDVELRGIQLISLFLAEQYISNCTEIQENGLIAIFDLEGLRFEHVQKLSVKELRRIIQTIQDGMPVRVAGCHFLNPPSLVWPIFKIAMRFLKEKIRKRVHLHYSHESLHQYLNKEKLPQSLGGDLSEEEATERHVMDDLLEKNVPYEKYWNGSRLKGNSVANDLTTLCNQLP